MAKHTTLGTINNDVVQFSDYSDQLVLDFGAHIEPLHLLCDDSCMA